jgi:hypothetical protein
MLTYEQIQSIAIILGWINDEVESAIAELNDVFMVPDVEFFCGPEDESIDSEISAPGYYHRLSTPGYLDCTNWSGPFDTENEAVADMLSVYAE